MLNASSHHSQSFSLMSIMGQYIWKCFMSDSNIGKDQSLLAAFDPPLLTLDALLAINPYHFLRFISRCQFHLLTLHVLFVLFMADKLTIGECIIIVHWHLPLTTWACLKGGSMFSTDTVLPRGSMVTKIHHSFVIFCFCFHCSYSVLARLSSGLC